MTGEVVSTQGRTHTFEAVKEFAEGQLGAKFLDALCCEGCVMGAGIVNELPLFARRRMVRQYVNHRMEGHRPMALARGYGADVRSGRSPGPSSPTINGFHAGS